MSLSLNIGRYCHYQNSGSTVAMVSGWRPMRAHGGPDQLNGFGCIQIGSHGVLPRHGVLPHFFFTGMEALVEPMSICIFRFIKV